MYDEPGFEIRSAKGSTMPDPAVPYSAIDAITSLNDTLDKQDRLLSELEGRTRFYRASQFTTAAGAEDGSSRDQDDNNSDLTNSLLIVRSRIRDHNETIQMILETLR